MTKLEVENTLVYDTEIDREDQNEVDAVTEIMSTVQSFVTCFGKDCVWKFSKWASVAVTHTDHLVVDGTFVTIPEKLPELVESRVEAIVRYAFDLLEEEIGQKCTLKLKITLEDYSEGAGHSYSPWSIRIDDVDGKRNLGTLTVVPAIKF